MTFSGGLKAISLSRFDYLRNLGTSSERSASLHSQDTGTQQLNELNPTQENQILICSAELSTFRHLHIENAVLLRPRLKIKSSALWTTSEYCLSPHSLPRSQEKAVNSYAFLNLTMLSQCLDLYSACSTALSTHFVLYFFVNMVAES